MRWGGDRDGEGVMMARVWSGDWAKAGRDAGCGFSFCVQCRDNLLLYSSLVSEALPYMI